MEKIKIIPLQKIRKRNGHIVAFDSQKITDAIARAGEETQEFDKAIAKKLTLKVLQLLEHTKKSIIPSVEEVQDVVEEVLLNSVFKKTAKAYVLYRDQHAKLREITSQAGVDLINQYLGVNYYSITNNADSSWRKNT